MGGGSSRPRRISSYFRKPAPLPRHRVSIGNWTKYVKNQRVATNRYIPHMWFLVGRSGGGRYDPARGCRKSFQSNYKCGNGPFKSRNVGAEAWGRWAFFDCRREINSCNAYRLILTDTGNIQFRYGGRIIWQSNTNKVGVEREEYMAKNGKYRRNYIRPGEYLEENEFIGSPSGNCYIIMTRSGLQLCYETFECKVNNELIGYGDTSNSYTLYEISKEDPDNIQNTGYVSYDGTLTEHTESFTTLEGLQNAAPYLDIGNHNSTDNSLTIAKFDGLSNADCKIKCDENNDCGGYFFSKNMHNGCELKNHMIKQQRYRTEDSSGLLYVKADVPKENNRHNTRITDTTGVDWDKYNLDNNSDIKRLTELGLITQDEVNVLTRSKKELAKSNNEFRKAINKLSIEDAGISLETKEDIKRFKKNLSEYTTLDTNSKDIKTKIYNLNAMEMDSELQLIKDNKEYLLWTIATIVVVIASMKIVKQK
mgnify:CR=1 FL=1